MTPLLCSLSAGLLLILAWPVSPFTPLIFIAWIPLLYLSENEKKLSRFFGYAYLSMVVWNIGTTWWIWNSTAPGAAGAIIINSFFMVLPLSGFYIFKHKYGQQTGWIAFVVFWLGFESIHLNWQLSWPWLTLGNVFATKTNWIQWYEYTGVSGGSFWVLIINIIIFKLLRSREKTVKYKYAVLAALLIFAPVAVSLMLQPKPTGLAASGNVIIVQPNIDPYSEKFDLMATGGQIKKLIELSESSLDSNTRLVLWPETALPIAVWQDQVAQSNYYKPVFDFADRHPGMALQTGIETLKNYGVIKATNTAKKDAVSGTFYDVFNAAISIKAKQPMQFYNKSKLVPGVETLPDFLLWMGAIFEKFGGTAGGYGHDNEAFVFKHQNNPYITAPIICYESIYGDYVSSYVSKGANLLTIMTNDGWWGNTAGHQHHLQYARLRAIETRKWVARSANTGISAVIDNTGEIIESRPWDVAAYIKFSIPAQSGETFYVKNGSIIFKLSIFLMVILLGYHWVIVLKKTANSKIAVKKFLKMEKAFLYNDEILHYTITGAGQHVILLHGCGEDRGVWKKQVAFLKDYFTIICPDLPGSGKSSFLKKQPAGMQDYATCIAALLLEEKIEQCVLLGHSMGGYITLAFAEMFPEKLKGFGLVNSTAFADSDEKKESRLKGIKLIKEHGACSFLRNTIPSLFSQNNKVKCKDSIDDLVAKAKQFTNETLIQYYTVMMNRADTTGALRSATVPVLFIAGEDDNAAPMADLLQQFHLPKTSDINILEKTGHMSMLEAANEVSKIIFEFVRDVIK